MPAPSPFLEAKTSAESFSGVDLPHLNFLHSLNGLLYTITFQEWQDTNIYKNAKHLHTKLLQYRLEE